LTPYFERDGESVRFVHPLFHKVAREWTKEQGRRLLLLLPFVEQMAKDTTPRARYNACCASSLIGKNAPQRTLSILEELAKDSVEFVQWAAVGTLSSLPLPTEYIFPLLERLLLDERCKEAALWSLKEIGEREPHQALHVAKEWAKKEELQEGCAILLSKTAATLPEEVAPLLQELMSAKKLEVKKAVSFALGELGKKMHTFALPLLQKLLKEGLKKEVAYSLKRMSKGREKEMFSLLFQLCKEGSAGIRWMVAHTIKYLKEMDASIRFSILASLLEDEELEVRKESLRALSHLGTHLPQKVLERMQDFFFAEGSIRDVAFEGVEELARSRASEALNYARDWMKREQTPYHFASLRALAGAQEAKAKDVLKLLPHLLKDKDDEIRKEACIVLAKAGKMHPEEAFPLLEELAHSAEKVLQEGVAQALRELARSHPSKVFSLIKRWAKEESWQIQRTLILALEQICKVKPTRVFEILEDFAKSKNERMRHIAAAALGEVGKILPQKAFSLLKRLSREGNRRVRFAAANSLHHMLLSQKAGYERTSV
jgi:HEAT repeat protein